MAFPVTRHTLIQRLAQGGEGGDWHDFLCDYWGVVCRYAKSTGQLSFEDSEDVASEVFEVILHAKLLQRWSESRTAKLRTLICSVVRNVLGNRMRVAQGRERIVREHLGQLDRYQNSSPSDPENLSAEQIDAFSAAWAESLVHTAIENLFTEYRNTRKADYFRVLYGRLCEGSSMTDIASSLRIPVSSADNFFRHARGRLTERLEELVRSHVCRYCAPEDVPEEFALEWNRLKDCLQRFGGLEKAIRSIYCSDQPTFQYQW